MRPQQHASMITFSGRMRSTASITDPGSTDFPPSCPDAAHEGNGAASSTPLPAVRGPVQTAAQVEIVVPVKDEERDLERSVTRLRAYLTDSLPFTAHVAIADNGSSHGTWAAAPVGSESAAPIQLAGARKIHYFVGANGDSFGGGSGTAQQISKWVSTHFKSQAVGEVTVYNLTEPQS
jgi:hypothetical protein